MKRFLLVCSIIVLLLSMMTLSPHTASAASMSTTHTTIAHHAASCTPNRYHPGSLQGVYDRGTGTALGSVEVASDGCGWVYAVTWTNGTIGNSGVINHIELWDINGGLVASAPYNGMSYNQTIHIQTNGRCLYAYAAIQVPNRGYWGDGTTSCSNGYN